MKRTRLLARVILASTVVTTAIAGAMTDGYAVVGRTPTILPAAIPSTSHYSVAEEHSLGTSYSGLTATRSDGPFTISSGSNCSNIYVTPVVYQTEWARFPSSSPLGSGWVEIGTAHRCSNDTKYWYWGYGYSVWYELGHSGPVSAVGHAFTLKRQGGSQWHMIVDYTDMGYVDYNGNVMTANVLQAGLETYDVNAVIPSHTYTSLRYTVNEGSWIYWAGFDGWSIDPGLCGGWNTASTWRAAENSSC